MHGNLLNFSLLKTYNYDRLLSHFGQRKFPGRVPSDCPHRLFMLLEEEDVTTEAALHTSSSRSSVDSPRENAADVLHRPLSSTPSRHNARFMGPSNRLFRPRGFSQLSHTSQGSGSSVTASPPFLTHRAGGSPAIQPPRSPFRESPSNSANVSGRSSPATTAGVRPHPQGGQGGLAGSGIATAAASAAATTLSRPLAAQPLQTILTPFQLSKQRRGSGPATAGSPASSGPSGVSPVTTAPSSLSSSPEGLRAVSQGQTPLRFRSSLSPEEDTFGPSLSTAFRLPMSVVMGGHPTATTHVSDVTGGGGSVPKKHAKFRTPFDDD